MYQYIIHSLFFLTLRTRSIVNSILFKCIIIPFNIPFYYLNNKMVMIHALFLSDFSHTHTHTQRCMASPEHRI